MHHNITRHNRIGALLHPCFRQPFNVVVRGLGHIGKPLDKKPTRRCRARLTVGVLIVRIAVAIVVFAIVTVRFGSRFGPAQVHTHAVTGPAANPHGKLGAESRLAQDLVRTNCCFKGGEWHGVTD